MGKNGGGGGGLIPNGCITQGRNGAVYGYDSSVPMGANTPDTIASTGQFIYANYWIADGTFIMRFGDLGNEQIPDVEFIFTVINGTLLQYVWNGARYQASNLTLATELIDDSVLDEDVCYTSLPILKKFISYDMNITDVEGTNTLINNTSYAPHFNAPVIDATQNGEGSILVDGYTDIITGFSPNLPQYSIEETVTGDLEDLIDGVGQGTFTQRTEQRLLTHNAVMLGDELVTNGAFDTDIAGWTISNATPAWDSDGFIELTPTSIFPSMHEQGSSNIDGNVLVTFRVKCANAIDVISVRVGVARVDLDKTYTDVGNWTTFSAVLESTSAYNFVWVGSWGGGTTGVPIYFDDISVKELTTENKYYINGIEQSSVPALPDPDDYINLNDTAVIGYEDTIESREAYFNVHTEILTPTLETVGQNLYPNFNMQNGSDIVQDVPTGTLPDGHVLAFNTANPCDAFYTTPDNIEYWYLFNTDQDAVRLVLQQTIGYGIFEVGKVYRYQARVRTLTDTPIGEELRALNISTMTDLVVVDADNAMIGENEDYTLRWIDFEVTNGATGRANFRHGAGVWDVLTTAQDTRDIAIYELGLSNDEIQITHNGEDVVHEREPVIK